MTTTTEYLPTRIHHYSPTTTEYLPTRTASITIHLLRQNTCRREPHPSPFTYSIHHHSPTTTEYLLTWRRFRSLSTSLSSCATLNSCHCLHSVMLVFYWTWPHHAANFYAVQTDLLAYCERQKKTKSKNTQSSWLFFIEFDEGSLPAFNSMRASCMPEDSSCSARM